MKYTFKNRQLFKRDYLKLNKIYLSSKLFKSNFNSFVKFNFEVFIIIQVNKYKY